MKENDELTAKVPRPIRAPRHLAGLTGKAIAVFAGGTIFFGAFFWLIFRLLIADQIIRLFALVAVIVSVGGILYLSLRVDEESGEMQTSFLIRMIVWKLSRHKISPQWEGKEEIVHVKRYKEPH